MNAQQKQFLDQATAEAQKANHPFPQMAAAEAALESGHWDVVAKVMIYGGSELARDDNNLFGMKQHVHPVFTSVSLPTREYLSNEWKTVSANWIKYPDWSSCFADRLATLQKLAAVYPHYKAAIEATDAETYIRQVSQTWSTDPHRADKVLAIYAEYTAA